MKDYDVIIIGAGVSGCAIARELAKGKLRIAVLEAKSDVCEGTSKANSGIVHAGYDAVPGTLKAQLNVRGNEMMEELSKKLDFPFRRNGSLVLCFEEDAMSGLEELYQRGMENGVKELKLLSPEEVWVYDHHHENVQALQQEYPGVHEAATEADAADAVEALILAVKPHGVLSLISSLSERGEELPLLISIAAAISLDDMEACASDGTRIVRAMPNTPCMVLAGVIAYSTGAAVTDEDEEAARRLLSGCGSVYKVEEARMNAVSAISGSGPAYMFTVLDALSDAGVAMGLSRKTALEMAVETMRGSALMLEQTGKHPMALRDEVTSPGGTTIAALNALDECGFRNAWIQAVKSAVRRAEEMVDLSIIHL